jgi:hypothetical protein
MPSPIKKKWEPQKGSQLTSSRTKAVSHQNGISSSISEKFGAGRAAGRLAPASALALAPAFWRGGGALL